MAQNSMAKRACAAISTLSSRESSEPVRSRCAAARVAAAMARVEEAKVRLTDPEIAFLEREEVRLKQLFESGDVSFRERDDAVRELAAARHRMTQIEASLPVLEAAIDEARANLASAQAALERSQTGLREATIRCPIDGIVLVRNKEVGDGVSSILTAGGNATQLMTLGDLSRMYVDARIDEVDLGRIRVGMPAVITVDAYRGRELSGLVQRIAPAGSVDGNGIVTFEVRVTVEDLESVLRPDMTADTKLVLDRRESVPTLPQRAVRRGKDGSWSVHKVVAAGGELRAEEVEVKLGLSDGLMTEIVEGVSEGDRVVLPSTPLERGR